MRRLFKYLWGLMKSFFNFIFCCGPKDDDNDSSLGIGTVIPERESHTSSGERSSLDSSEALLNTTYNLARTPSKRKTPPRDNYRNNRNKFLGNKDPKIKDDSNSNDSQKKGKPRSLSL